MSPHLPDATLPLDAVLPVVLPLLTPALAGEEAITIPPLYAMARELPPVARGGFECRLSAGSSAIDLHQAIRRARSEQHVLAAYLAKRGEQTRSHPAWASLRRFAKWWSEAPSEVAEQIAALFLELDSDATHPGGPVPSAFFKLDATGGLPARQARAIVEELLDVLGLPAATPRLSEVFAACGEQAVRITHVGTMLSRETRVLRVNIASGRPAAAPAFLRSVGWEDDHDALARDAEWLHDYVDHVVCCLDVDEVVYPHIGLECFIDDLPTTSGKWRRFVDALVERTLCDPAKGANLLAFHSLLTPATSTAAWPDPLIVETLLDDAERFSAFACRLHHIKLTLAPGRPVTAKGYLGFAHQWLGLAASQDEPVDDPARPTPIADERR